MSKEPRPQAASAIGASVHAAPADVDAEWVRLVEAELVVRESGLLPSLAPRRRSAALSEVQVEPHYLDFLRLALYPPGHQSRTRNQTHGPLAGWDGTEALLIDEEFLDHPTDHGYAWDADGAWDVDGAWGAGEGWGDARPRGGEADPLSGGGDQFGTASLAPGVRLAALLDAFPPAGLGVRDVADAVAAWERVIGWATAKQAEAAAELTRRPELRPDDDNGRYASLHPIPVAAGALCAVRSWTKPQAEKLVDHAVTLVEHYPAVHQALFEGRLDAAKAHILTRALAKCDADVAALIQKAVLPFVHGWTDVKLSRVLNELLHELDAAGAKRRHREARSRRDVRVEPAEDGMAWLIAYLPAEEATAIMAALNAAADAEAGRTCLHSQTCTHHHTDDHHHDTGEDDDTGHDAAEDPSDDTDTDTDTGSGSGSGSDADVGTGDTKESATTSEDAKRATPGRADAGRDPADRAGSGGCGVRTRAQRRADALASFGWSSLATGHLGGQVCAGCGSPAGTRLAHAHGRPVSVNLTLPMTSLLGLNEHPAHLDGYGPIDADAARALAAAGFWRWVGTAAAGGHAIDYGVTRYSPPQDLVDFVLLRDRECVAPGCHRPATRCQIDHRTPWPYGPTSACNCSALCKPCHLQKHHAGWTVKHLGNGRQRWTSPTGHSTTVQIPSLAPDARQPSTRTGTSPPETGPEEDPPPF